MEGRAKCAGLRQMLEATERSSIAPTSRMSLDELTSGSRLAHWHTGLSGDELRRAMAARAAPCQAVSAALNTPRGISAGVHFVNKLPNSIKNARTPKVLKTRLKRFLVSQAFYNVDEFLAYDWETRPPIKKTD
ncbi:hypothetical protein J6590_032120 [Homalodisca vitripennis]|nr:hypothetical protein J6590_032120 [Homalodisca vitripennis]